jgi:hypothetical protein
MPARAFSPRPGPTTGTAALLAAYLLLPAPILAQVDIESLRRDDAPTGVSGSLGGDLTLTTGNVDFVQVAANGRLNWVRGQATTLAIGEGDLGFLSGDRFSSSGLFHLRTTHWVESWIAPEWYAQVNYDRPQLLDFRALAGGGVRLQFAQGPWGALGAGVSVMLEHERLDLPSTALHDDRTRTLRNSTFVTVRLVGGERLVASSTTYLQPALDDVVGDMRVLQNTRLAASLTDRLALTVTFDLRYDSGAPDGISALDTELKTGVTLTY